MTSAMLLYKDSHTILDREDSIRYLESHTVLSSSTVRV